MVDRTSTEREFSRPVLKQFQKKRLTNLGKAGLIIETSQDSHNETPAGKRTHHHGHENKSLEAKAIIEQSSFQNELHQTRTRIQQTLPTDR